MIYYPVSVLMLAGIRAIMLNSNDRSKDICEYFRQNKSKYSEIAWYPSIPYLHKYANLVAEKGIFPAINEVLFSNNTAIGALSMITKRSMAVFETKTVRMGN